MKLWYCRVSLFMTCAWILIFASLLMLEDNIPAYFNFISFDILFPIILGLGFIVLICDVWLCPYYASDDDRMEFKHSPRVTVGELKVTAWLFPCIFIVGSMLLLSLTLLLAVLNEISWGAPGLLMANGLVLVGLIMALSSVWVSRRLKPRVIQMAGRRQICFECAYDLHGNPDATACPECGEAVTQMRQVKNLVTDHPGQGPVGHDRA